MVEHKSGILEAVNHTTRELFRKLPEKFMAVMGTIAVAATGVGLTGCSTEGYDPNKDVTPDTTATLETPQSTPTADAESQTAPTLEADRVMKFYGEEELQEKLPEAKDMNETCGILFKFFNMNMPEEYRQDTDEYGRMQTESRNSAETTKSMGEWTLNAIKVAALAIKYGNFNEETNKQIMRGTVDGLSAGMGHEFLSIYFEQLIDNRDTNIDHILFNGDESNKLNTLLEGSAANPESTTKECRNQFNNYTDSRNRMNYKDLNFGGCPPAYYSVLVSKSPDPSKDYSLMFSVVISSNTDSKDPSVFNKDARKAPNNDNSYSIDKNRFFRPILLDLGFLWEGSPEIIPINGEETLASTSAEVTEFSAAHSTTGFDKDN